MNAEKTRPQAIPEDYSSIVLTLDHIADGNESREHTVHKFVASTETVNEALLSLLNYYGLTSLLARPSTLEMFQQAHAPVGLPVFVLHTTKNTQVITDVDTWAVLASVANSSVLGATDLLIGMVNQHFRNSIEQQGAAPTLSLLMLSAQDPDASQAQQAQPEGQTVDVKIPRKRTRAKANA